jgi:hypothetical protein
LSRLGFTGAFHHRLRRRLRRNRSEGDEIYFCGLGHIFLFNFIFLCRAQSAGRDRRASLFESPKLRPFQKLGEAVPLFAEASSRGGSQRTEAFPN